MKKGPRPGPRSFPVAAWRGEATKRAMIQVEKLTKHFGPVRAVDGIDFHVGEGEVVGFLGPNGAGKSTTIRMLTCFLPPTSGRARVAGFDIFQESMEVRSRVGYLPETVPLYPEMRVREFLRFRAALKGVSPRRARNARVEEVMDLCGVTEVARKLVGHVSRGYRQRVGLAEALAADPPILVLDEPTSGLDPNQVVEVRDLIRALAGEKTVLLSSHVLSEVAQICGRVFIVDRGRLVASGTPAELAHRFGTERRLLLRVAGGLDPAAVRGVPGVVRIEPAGEPGSFRIAVENPEESAPAVVEAVLATGARVVELRHEGLDLEAVFRAVTRGKNDA